MRFFILIAVIFLGGSVFAADSATSPYPLTTCVVSGDKLGAMGSPVSINYKGTEIRFCCHECVASFNENPAKYLAKLPMATQK